MRIRTAVDADAPTIVALAAQLFAEDSGRRDRHADVDWPVTHGHGYYAEAIRSGVALVLLAEGVEPIGYLIGRHEPPNPLRPGAVVVELESMFVRPGNRCSGVGGGLMDAFRGWARERGADVLTVTAYAANARAHAFYRRLGFAEHKVVLEAPEP